MAASRFCAFNARDMLGISFVPSTGRLVPIADELVLPAVSMSMKDKVGTAKALPWIWLRLGDPARSCRPGARSKSLSLMLVWHGALSSVTQVELVACLLRF